MSVSVINMALPDLPDIYEMTHPQRSYRLSDQGRAETASIRQRFLTQLHKGREDSNLCDEYRFLQEARINNLHREDTLWCGRERAFLRQPFSAVEKTLLHSTDHRWSKGDLLHRPPFYKAVHVESRSPFHYPHKQTVTTQSFLQKVPLRPSTGEVANHCHFEADLNFNRGKEPSRYRSSYSSFTKPGSSRHGKCMVVKNSCTENNTSGSQKAFTLSTDTEELVLPVQDNDNLANLSNQRSDSGRNKQYKSHRCGKFASIDSPMAMEANDSVQEHAKITSARDAKVEHYLTPDINVPNNLSQTESRFSWDRRLHNPKPSQSDVRNQYVPEELKRKRHFIDPEWTSESVEWRRYGHASHPLHLRYSWM